MSIHDEAATLARSIFELRKRRARHLPEAALSETAWNILLALFVADADGRRTTGAEVIALAEVAASAGERWVRALHGEGLVIGDGSGNLDDIIALTPAGISAVEACMIDAQEFLQSRMARKAAA